MARSIPQAAERFGWQKDGDIHFQHTGEGEPLFSEEELDQHLAENPDITQGGSAEDSPRRGLRRLRHFLHIHRGGR